MSPSLSTSPVAIAFDALVSAGSVWIGVDAPKPFRVTWSKKKSPWSVGAPSHDVVDVVKQRSTPSATTRTNGPAGTSTVIGVATPSPSTSTSIVSSTATVLVLIWNLNESPSRWIPGSVNVAVSVSKLAATPPGPRISAPSRLRMSTSTVPATASRTLSPVTAIVTTPVAFFWIRKLPPSS